MVNLVIFGGDPVVGNTLELLISDIEYAAKHLDENGLNQPGALDGVEIALLGPNWNGREREFLQQTIERTLPGVEVPVLEVGPPADGAPANEAFRIPWPCRAEDLKYRVEVARRAGSERADQYERRSSDQGLHRGG